MKNRIHILAVFALLAVGALLVRVDRVQAAAGDSNFTNIVTSGDITAGDDVTVGDDLTVTDKVTAPNVVIGSTPEMLRLYSTTLVSGAKTFTVSGPSDIDGCICGRKGSGSGGTPDIECTWSSMVLSIADGSGSATSDVNCLVWGSP